MSAQQSRNARGGRNRRRQNVNNAPSHTTSSPSASSTVTASIFSGCCGVVISSQSVNMTTCGNVHQLIVNPNSNLPGPAAAPTPNPTTATPATSAA
ncbi:hypothetical protein BJ165DRAFT_1604997 [Panaeolus papilionaceus]|nr:hypothetical protein BJ165DRAFT_1604997 [Panaeolus papilionaceus]